MYELVRINDRDFYVDMPAKAGAVLLEENSLCLIDSGNDKDAAKKILKVTEEKGWKISHILNTHSHADHMGGNRLIQDRTGCSIHVPEMEESIAQNPIFEPLMLYGGRPLKGLESKFLMAKPSMTGKEFPEAITRIGLPGHSPSMTGYITQNRTAYIGDVITSAEILDKYGLSYTYDIGQALESIEKASHIDADVFIPSHAEVTSDITKLCEYNRRKMLEGGERIEAFLKEPLTFEQILKKVFDTYGMNLTLQQYALIGSTVRAYLTWLCEKGKAEYFFEDNMMYWRRV